MSYHAVPSIDSILACATCGLVCAVDSTFAVHELLLAAEMRTFIEHGKRRVACEISCKNIMIAVAHAQQHPARERDWPPCDEQRVCIRRSTFSQHRIIVSTSSVKKGSDIRGSPARACSQKQHSCHSLPLTTATTVTRSRTSPLPDTNAFTSYTPGLASVSVSVQSPELEICGVRLYWCTELLLCRQRGWRREEGRGGDTTTSGCRCSAVYIVRHDHIVLPHSMLYGVVRWLLERRAGV